MNLQQQIDAAEAALERLTMQRNQARREAATLETAVDNLRLRLWTLKAAREMEERERLLKAKQNAEAVGPQKGRWT